MKTIDHFLWYLLLFTLGFIQVNVSSQPFFSGISEPFVTDSKPPIISVIKPNGGESIFNGSPFLVKWDASDDSFGSTPISIALSTDGGSNFMILNQDIPDTDSTYVNPPLLISDQSLIKVAAKDIFGLTNSDISDGFFLLQGTVIKLKAFLEGPFTGGGMLAYLNFFDYLPLNQPYNTSPWNYTGTETVFNIPNNDIIDWVLLEIRDAIDASSATSSTIIARKAGFILENGKITDLDGSSDIQLNILLTNQMFIVVRHRNHAAIMSSQPLIPNINIFTYDFSSGSQQVFGEINGHKQLSPGIWGMIGGDGNGDGEINNIDKINVWKVQSGSSGYKSGDYDMNGNVDNQDKIEVWDPNTGKGSQVPL